MKKNIILGILFAQAFFLSGLFTLSDYGLNIDEPNHFMRGQALLHYMRTGEKTYENLDVPRRSQWQENSQNGVYYLEKKTASHPTANDISAAFFNFVFYQNLGWVGDLQAYHLYEVFVSSLLVFLVFLIASSYFGTFAGIVSAISLGLYPLFLGESSFNIKDPVEATFFSFSVFLIFLAFNKKRFSYFILSGVFFAFAAGTKFNAFFIPFIFLPYLLVRFSPDLEKYKLAVFKKIPIKIYAISIFSILISFSIYLYLNPQLWLDPIGKIINEQLLFYKQSGVGTNYQPDYLFYGFNLYPSFFITISTPVIILFLSIVGVFAALKRIPKERDKFSLLLLLWFAIPIIRVTIPGTTIYTGVRQIMEYIPATAILAGLGATYLVSIIDKYFVKLTRKRLSHLAIKAFILALSLPLLFKLIQIHPNENVFMNSLIGGLPGAVEKQVPGAAETLGNVYLQGLWWLNENAEKGASYKLPLGLSSNIPTQFARKDLKLAKYYSGMERRGEYMMEMISVDFPPPRFSYNYRYLENFVNPVHEVKVDGVTLLKVWKNDLEHTKKGYIHEKEEDGIQVLGKEEGYIKIILREPSYLTRLEIEHENTNCLLEGGGSIFYSLDDNEVRYARGQIENSRGTFQGSYADSLQTDNFFVFFFVASPAKFIQLVPDDPRSCLLSYRNITVKSLRDLKP